jgi:D-serine deaminase-like pyridoxal phosphate-dependent protein/L-amino acid N-acyltransferase YncA
MAEVALPGSLTAPSLEPMTPDDWPAVLRIYREGMATGDATFETEAPTWGAWDAGHVASCRFVARVDGHVVGWTALGPYSSRRAYRGVAWESVYVAESVRGERIGTALLRAVVPASEASGFWMLLAGVLAENAASLAVHERAGFRRVGVQRRVARDAAGRWRDVFLMERRSPIVGADANAAPAETLSSEARSSEDGRAVVAPVAPLLPPGLETPCLVIDLDLVEANARRLAAAVAARGVALRPHTKTHKSVALARIQLEAGASGITVGTLGEAEVMAAGGIDDIFIAYPVWAVGERAARLRALVERESMRLSVGFDSVAAAERLAAAVSGARRPLRVLVEVDPGTRRTGVAPAIAGPLAAAARELGLEVAGAFTFGGHAYAGREAIEPAAADEVASLVVAAEGLRGVGIEPAVLSAGSTPTALGAATNPVTEVRPGTYLLGDRIEVALGASPPDGVAIAIAATVVSTAVPGQVVIDAGTKTLSKDRPAYLEGFGFLPAYPDAILEHLYDYHGVVRIPEDTRRPALGEVVAVIPNHACPVVDLHDDFVASRAGVTIGRWPVDARGRSG